MRKLAPAFILSSIIALASGSALALGDMNKNKQAPKSPDTTQSSNSTSSGYGANNPSGSVSGPTSSGTGSTSGSTPAGDTGSLGSKTKQSQNAQNDNRCDAAKYPNRSDLPKECLTKSGTGAAAANSHDGQAGSSGAGGAGGSGSGGSGSGGSGSGG